MSIHNSVIHVRNATLYAIDGFETLDYDEARDRQIRGGGVISLRIATLYVVDGFATLDYDEAQRRAERTV